MSKSLDEIFEDYFSTAPAPGPEMNKTMSTNTTTNETPWYDSREGLEAKLEEGLSGLWEIQEVRRQAKSIRPYSTMREWCLLGLFFLDRYGQFSRIIAGAPADALRFRHYDAEPKFSDVMDWDSACKIQSGSMTTERGGLPPVGAVCDRCGKVWTIHNLSSYNEVRVPGDKCLHRHEGCHRLAIVDKHRKVMTQIFQDAKIEVSDMVTIPSGYHSDDLYFGPWFVAETEKGKIVIGWRKRVIHIGWSDSSLPAGSTLFGDEDVTKGSDMIHAWCADDAVRYLRMLWGNTGDDLFGDHLSPDATLVASAYDGVAERVHRLSHTADISGAFLLYNSKIVVGHCADARLDKNQVATSLCHLAQVFYTMDDQFKSSEGQLQASVGEQRLVISSLGDPALGFQVGLVARACSPVCKSLPRLLRQIDRAFCKARAKRADMALVDIDFKPLPPPEGYVAEGVTPAPLGDSKP